MSRSSRLSDLHGLLARSQVALGLPHREFGPLLGSSLRTAERWAAQRSTPTPTQLAQLTRHVHARDPALAAELAAALGGSLESLGIVAPAAATIAAAAPAARLVDIVVCAAAEAIDASPRAMRLALHAALASARSLGLDLATLEDALAPRTPPAAPRTTPRRRARTRPASR
jgi:hypothetical protein